jgi:hypothetical protein
MSLRVLTTPEVAFIAATRGMLGAGIGLLASSKLNDSYRRSLGLALVIVGAVTTIPAAAAVFGNRNRAIIEAAP